MPFVEVAKVHLDPDQVDEVDREAHPGERHERGVADARKERLDPAPVAVHCEADHQAEQNAPGRPRKPAPVVKCVLSDREGTSGRLVVAEARHVNLAMQRPGQNVADTDDRPPSPGRHPPRQLLLGRSGAQPIRIPTR